MLIMRTIRLARESVWESFVLSVKFSVNLKLIGGKKMFIPKT